VADTVAVAPSSSQRAAVTTVEAVLVTYDYAKLKVGADSLAERTPFMSDHTRDHFVRKPLFRRTC
jgi:hypothetical protein